LGIILSYYTIKVFINPLDMKHGQDLFDKKYYRRFFKDYSQNELLMYYRWSLGWIRFLDSYLPLKSGSGKKVFEIGCSIGAFSKILKERGFEVTATDVSSYIINKAKKIQEDIDFRVLDIERESRLRDKYDYIFCFETIEHLKNPVKGLTNMKNALRKEGVLVISTPFPTKRSLADPTHINVHEPAFWMNLANKLKFRKRRILFASFIPFLYRLSDLFSWGFPLKTDIPFVNSTTFLIFEK